MVVCGAPFILYILCLLFAIGMAKNSRQVIEVGLLNYLWPMFTLFLSVPILKKHATLWIIPGTIVALSGVMLANIIINNLQINFLDFWVNFKGSMLPYLLGFSAAILWGLYSNLACRLSTTSNVYNIPLFLLSTGILLLIIRCFITEQSTWNGVAVVELITIVIFPTIVAYVMWDSAMRRGNMILIVSLAYFSPLISTVLTGLYLGVDLTIGLWIACSLVIIGAWISKNSIKQTGR
jgi:drug/metabolite transporter (DMT)-like permease